MNFFEHQDRARTKTKKLIFLFLLAVFSLVIIINLFAMLSFGFIKPEGDVTLQGIINQEFFQWQIFGYIGLGVLAFILIVSLIKRSELLAGGKVIAEKLGGRLILSNTQDLKERRLINIVEEISIASGVPVPPVYLIDEDGINAFAAGFNINDAVIGVTKGAIQNLNREELQGVIAHEFSHIFNGDMRLNLKLISILHGILVIGIIGYYIMRSSSGGRRSKDSGGVLMFGLGLMIIGYVGTFFGNLIKASVSRQREYLADASAVQFTRNPLGIGCALKKIAALSEGSKITNPKAEEFSHMFFSKSSSSFFSFFMATHPPINKRILAIDPNWNGELDYDFKEDELKTRLDHQNKPNNDKRIMSMASIVGSMIQNSGNITQESITQAHDLIIKIPENIKEAASNPYSARALIYSLLIQKSHECYQKQLDILRENADPKVFKITKDLHLEIEKANEEMRLSLIDLSITSLRQLSQKQYEVFKNNVELLVKADSKIDLFEWCLMKIIFNSLDREFSKNHKDKEAKYNLQAAKNEVSMFLSLMAYTGHKTEENSKKAFEIALANQKLVGFNFTQKSEIKISVLDKVILKLEQLRPLEKEKLLKACATCITQNEVQSSELELLRAFASILNCPMPLLNY